MVKTAKDPVKKVAEKELATEQIRLIRAIDGNKLPDNYKKVKIGEQEWHLAPSMKKRFLEEDKTYTLPLQSTVFNLRKRQAGFEDSETSESSISRFDTPKPVEEKPVFVSPMDIKNILGDTNDIIGPDKDAEEPEEVIPTTGQLDIDDDELFKSKKVKLADAPTEIDLDDDDEGLPSFYDGESEAKSEEEEKKEKKKKIKKSKLMDKIRLRLTDKDMMVNMAKLENEIKPPED